eukprot:1157243-Pelagomonas_calceolata.AAC.9
MRDCRNIRTAGTAQHPLHASVYAAVEMHSLTLMVCSFTPDLRLTNTNCESMDLWASPISATDHTTPELHSLLS